MTRLPARTASLLSRAARHRWRLSGLAWALTAALGAHGQGRPDLAAPPAMAASQAALRNSGLDAPMFYQLLVGEMEAQEGRLANAYEVMLDAARRSHDSGLYQRAVELGIQMRSGDQALAAAKAWRAAHPESIEATRTMLQLAVALDRPGDLAEPLRALLQQLKGDDRTAAIAGMPRFLENMSDKSRAFATVEQALAPYATAQATRTAVRVTLGRMALAADKPEQALSLDQRALADDPDAPGPVLLALDLMPREPTAEALVQAALARPDAPAMIRMAYARTLEQRQRVVDAIAQMRLALQQQPDLPQGWLSLGAALLDLHETDAAVDALHRAQAQLPVPAAAGAASSPLPSDTDDHRLSDVIWQLLAQAAELRGDDAAVTSALSHIDPARADLSVRVSQAGVLARAGHVDEALALVREAPAADHPNDRARLLAQTQVLRSAKRWQQAYDLLLEALRKTPDDTDLMYEMAMLADQLDRPADMEALLRRNIALKPDDAQALNALGYSLADRNQRLDEALALIRRAVAKAPDDPFVADSLGWVEYRLGHRDEALRILRKAYAQRPHVEVAAHLGEVLWTGGQKDEALKVWREGAARDPDNEVLRKMLARLQVHL